MNSYYYLGLLILPYLLLSIFLGPQEQYLAVKYSLEDWESDKVSANPSLHPGDIETREQDDVYMLYKPNITKYTDDWYKKRVIRINSRGLRDEDFQTKAENDKRRILVLGDSFTWGVGVNASDRYTDIMEERLNQDKDRYEVINTGVAGSGIKDFVQLFRERGKDYDPDVVVVSVASNDIWSRSEIDNYRSGIIKENKSIERPLSSEDRKYLNRRVMDYKKSSLRADSNGSKLIEGLEKISSLTGNTPVIVHGYLLNENHSSEIRTWTEKKENIFYVSQNPKFSIIPSSVYIIPYDRHYNRLGHIWMADQLTPKVREVTN